MLVKHYVQFELRADLSLSPKDFSKVNDEKGAPLARLERASLDLVDRCSIQLSYRGDVRPPRPCNGGFVESKYRYRAFSVLL